MKNWKVEKVDKELVKNIVSDTGIPSVTAMLMSIRGISAPEDAEKFLYENEELDDPFLMTDMEKAVERIEKAIDKNERICIYGDYDADGVTSTAMLYDYLSGRGAAVDYYIPSREAEGYGMNNGAVDKIAESGANLIITVDNGISAVNEIEYARSLGIDTVVTDHHTPPQELPKAVAVVNPHRKDCMSEFKFLSGVGVVFKLIMAMEDDNSDTSQLLERYSDIAAIGTIGDIVSLTGENRILVKNGLQKIMSLHNTGITALLETSGIKGNKLTAGRISFTLVPRINACGRLSFSEKSVTLLLTKDKELARSIAHELSEDNKTRQDIEKQILDEVIRCVEKNPHIKYKPVMVISGEGWHQGVIGIVSSRIKDIYGKPNIIITTDGENAKGSGRSIEGFSLIEAITECSDLLTVFGGHPMAAGLSMKTSDIEEFSIRLNAFARSRGVIMPTLNIDFKLNPKFLTLETVQAVSMLEPFGAGNPTPVFGLYNMCLKSIVPVGGGKHLRLEFQRESVIINTMMFFTTAEQFPYIVNDTVDLAVTADINDYNNRQSVSIIIKDIKPSGRDNAVMLEYNGLFEKLMDSASLTNEEALQLLPSRDDFAVVFKFLRKQGLWKFPTDIMCSRINRERINYGRLQVIIKAMEQLSIIEIKKSESGFQTILVLPSKGKAELGSAGIMRQLNNYVQSV
ncbi:MAG: single-stranded-DNA-specific exonuclease RecJ [Clostridia bacterium]|nr:single-stranded-DNA-specific exonuclease RecJ [Clostridia bacterium]